VHAPSRVKTRSATRAVATGGETEKRYRHSSLGWQCVPCLWPALATHAPLCACLVTDTTRPPTLFLVRALARTHTRTHAHTHTQTSSHKGMTPRGGRGETPSRQHHTMIYTCGLIKVCCEGPPHPPHHGTGHAHLPARRPRGRKVTRWSRSKSSVVQHTRV
jgi:hypothetical protein